MSSPTADWDACGDTFYRKTKLYDAVFGKDLELENYLVAGAPYSGAIALVRDEGKLQSYRGSQATKTSIDIYSCAGKLIRQIKWDKGSIRSLGWSEDEKLLVITSDGTVRCYTDLQGDFTQFSLGHGAEEHGVRTCRFWAQGFVALLANNHLIAVSNYVEARPKLLATPPGQDVHSWTLIPPAYTLSRSVEALVSIGQTIYVVDATEAEDRVLSNGPFKHVTVSPNGQYVALYTVDGKVWVITSDFQNKIGEYESKTRTPPKDVQWCGNDSVLLAWEDEIHMVGPNGALLKYYYDDWVHLLPDIDGVRIITNDICEFLQKVPDPTESIFRPGSSSPSAILIDALSQFDAKSPKANSTIQLIHSSLPDAISLCVSAAAHEYSIPLQRTLLKAASFGKSMLEFFSSDDYVDTCTTLRVLTAVRDYKIGLPLSLAQYQQLTPSRLIRRLIHRHEYLLALRLSEYLHLPTNDIYVHWATQKVRHSASPEDTILSTVVSRLSTKRGISFEAIARAAYDEGRSHLATELLNYETRAGKQVPLLLMMEEGELALDKALSSGDTDLVFSVLFHLKTQLPLSSFFRLLSTRPIASSLVISSAKAQDTDLLKSLYYQDDRRLDGANLLFSDALHQTTPQTKTDKIRLALKILSDSPNTNTKDPPTTFHRTALSSAAQLLKFQSSLDAEAQTANNPQPLTPPQGYTHWLGTPLHPTILSLISQTRPKPAQKLAQDFHLPDKTYTWLRLRGLVAARAWPELESLASGSTKQRPPPIGWEPFFEECLAAGNPRSASVFIPKLTGKTGRERSEMWMRCGRVRDAAEELGRAKDGKGLEELRGRVKSVGDVAEVERVIKGLAGGRGRR